MTKEITQIYLIKVQFTPNYQSSYCNDLQLTFVPDSLKKKHFDDTWSQQTFVLKKTCWRCLTLSSSEDIFKTSSRRLDQNEYARISLTSSVLRLQKPRRLGQDQYICLGHTSSRRLQDVFKTSSRRLAKTSLGNLQNFLPRRLAKIFSRCFQDVSSS